MSDIRTALEEAFSKEDAAPAQETVAAPVAEVQEPEVAAPRDDAGRFTKDEPKAETIKVEVPDTPTEAPKAPVRNPFSSWKPDAQAALSKAERGEALTPDELKLLRVEAERRESDFHRGVSEFKTHSDRARAYDQAVAPYQAHLQTLGVDAPTAISALMRADMTLRTSDPATKAQYFANLAKEYGIDLGQVQQPQNVDPQTQYLMDQLNELRQNQQVWQNQLQQQEQLKAQQELKQFATADKPHFDAVRNDMADLLESGKAKSMQDAYDMAVWMRPDIRTTLIEQQRAEAQQKAIETSQNMRAKTAAVSVKGSSPVAGGIQPQKGSLRDILEANFADNS